MIAHKKEFYGGAVLLAAFFAVLIVIFLPVFNGQNGLDALDGLYNSISKGSAYYIPQAQDAVEALKGTQVEVNLTLKSENQAQQTALLFSTNDGAAAATATDLVVRGDLGRMLSGCLTDSEDMYQNLGQNVADRYGYNERQALYNWWTALNSMEKALQKQKQFKEAKIVSLVNKKAVETAYNYYEIEPLKITEKLGTVIFSLVFYVVYTLWYGFAILFLFEGWGMRLEH